MAWIVKKIRKNFSFCRLTRAGLVSILTIKSNRVQPNPEDLAQAG